MGYLVFCDCDRTEHFEGVDGFGQRREIDAHGQSQTEPVAPVCPSRRTHAPTAAANRAGLVTLPAQEKLRKGAALFARARCGESGRQLPARLVPVASDRVRMI